MRVKIGSPVVRTDGRSAYGHVITKFSGMGRFTKLCGSAHARGAPLLPEQQKKREKMSYFAVGMETGKLIIGYRAQQITS